MYLFLGKKMKSLLKIVLILRFSELNSFASVLHPFKN